MTKYELNNTNIDIVSEKIMSFLSNGNVDSKDMLRIRLSAEEILMKYLDLLGEKKSFELFTVKRFKTLRIELHIPGESMNPFMDDAGEESFIMGNLLASFGLAPVWNYKNGKNIIVFTARKKKKTSQIFQIGAAIVAAFIGGSLCQILPQNVSDFLVYELVTPIFNTFMGLLSAISGPIIFLSVVWGICGIGDMATFGKIGKKMIGRFLLISCGVGILGTFVCLPFFGMSSSGETAFVFSDLFQMILDIIPGNLFTPFTEGNSLQIIFIAIIVGLAMLVLGNSIPLVIGFIEQTNSVIQTIMGVVCSFIPFFVFGSIFTMVAENKFSIVLKSYKSVLVMVLGDVIIMAIYLLAVCIRKKVSPVTLIKKLMPTFIIGATTCSSIAAFATNVDTCEKKLGIEKRIIEIGVPLGQVIFMPGCILCFMAPAYGMAEVFGSSITPVWMITALIICVIVAIAAPPVPGATITCYTILFMQLNIPAEAIAVVVALNVILEFITTGVNLFCLQTELICLSSSLGTLDVDMLRREQTN